MAAGTQESASARTASGFGMRGTAMVSRCECGRAPATECRRHSTRGRMSKAQWIACAALVLSGGVARAEAGVPLIDRPLTLPRGTFAATVDLPYTNRAGGAIGTRGNSTGEALAFGADYGVSDRFQLGLAAAFPIQPGAGFGSLLQSGELALDEKTALRLDVGYERIGVNGAPANQSGPHSSRYFGGLGAPAKIALTPALAFVSGRAGAVHFGHFNNLGDNGVGFYSGGSALTETG